MGVKNEALRRGQPNTDIAFYIARTGKLQGRVKTDPQWCVCVVRQEFLEDLASLLERSAVHRRTIVDEVALENDESVSVLCQSADDKVVSRHAFDCLIAADGVHSIVRKNLFASQAVTYDRGFSCLYFLIESHERDAPAKFVELANGTRSELFLGTFSTTTVFPMGHNRLALGIGFDHATKARLWSEAGLAPSQDWSAAAPKKKKAIALKLTADIPMYDDLFTHLVEHFVPDWNSYKIYLWSMRDSNPLQTPYLEHGNLVVIGDAAHAFTPTIGMGASLAIEDAEKIASKIAAVAKTSSDPKAFRQRLRKEAFVPFTQERLPVWNELMHRARWAARGNFTQQGDRKRFAMAPQIPGYLPSRLVGAMEWCLDKVGL
jgi:salicylate hydroxylase